MDSDSEPEDKTDKALRKRGTTAKDPGKHGASAAASAQKYVPPAARGGLMQGERACSPPSNPWGWRLGT